MNQTALLLLIPIAIGTVASHFVYRPVILIITFRRSLLLSKNLSFLVQNVTPPELCFKELTESKKFPRPRSPLQGTGNYLKKNSSTKNITILITISNT